MKIGLLTLPLHNNYGGILQCYALYTILKRMGHEVVVVRRERPPYKKGIQDYMMDVAKCMTHVFLGRKHTYSPTKNELRYLHRHITRFIDKYIQPHLTPAYSTDELRKQCVVNKYEAFVVGSDQVWRPRYTASVGNYYLDFVEDIHDIKRIAYAASFGTDDWEYTAEETETCGRLIRKFQHVSVRENSAIEICKTKFHMKAELVLDPTMLLERADYEALVLLENEKKRQGNLFCYVLDRTQEKDVLIDKLSSELSMLPFFTMPIKSHHVKENMREHIEECVYPPVTQWIRSFIDAEMIITDSFHGCVFSIIFNKPFWVIGNEKRGMVRFESLLGLFGLQDRIISAKEVPDWERSIDWGRVNDIHRKMKNLSINFLDRSLGT